MTYFIVFHILRLFHLTTPQPTVSFLILENIHLASSHQAHFGKQYYECQPIPEVANIYIYFVSKNHSSKAFATFLVLVYVYLPRKIRGNPWMFIVYVCAAVIGEFLCPLSQVPAHPSGTYPFENGIPQLSSPPLLPAHSELVGDCDFRFYLSILRRPPQTCVWKIYCV